MQFVLNARVRFEMRLIDKESCAITCNLIRLVFGSTLQESPVSEIEKLHVHKQIFL